MARKRLWYPGKQDIINNNKRVLRIYKANKSDIHQVKAESKIFPAIQNSKKEQGDVFKKATRLIISLNKAHPFQAGNKRTAYFSGNQFIAKNKGFLVLKKRDNQRDIMIKIREERIKDSEVLDWLKNPKKKKKYGKER